MERLFKITNLYRSSFKGKNAGDPDREKLELTLCYHETMFSSQTGVGIRQQYVNVTLFDDMAKQWQLPVGTWIVGLVSMSGYPSRTEQGRLLESHYLERFIVVNDWNLL